MEHVRPRIRVQIAKRASFLRQFRKIEQDHFRQEGQQDVERVWVAPNGKFCAYLIRSLKDDTHRLYVADRLLFEGVCHLSEKDFVWSPNSTQYGAHIHTTDDPYADAFILTSASEQYDIPEGFFLREFLIDDQGLVSAWIISDGDVFSTQIYERNFPNFSMAQCLHWTNFGSIAFEAVRDGQTLHITDETELLLH